jgi:hypothetical protein
MAAEPESFEEAVSRFEVFLTENGYSTNLIWIEASELVLSSQHSIYVKLPAPARNLSHARDCFERGRANGLGVNFGTIRELRNATCCYAWVPKDEVNQQNHLMGRGLKLTAKTGSSRLTGVIVKSQFHWWFLKLRHRRHSDLRDDLFRWRVYEPDSLTAS